MPQENPTGESGASTLERLENFLAAEESPAEPQPKAKASEGGDDDPPQDLPEPADPAEPDDNPQDDEPEEGNEPQLTTAELAKLFGVDESTLDVDQDGNVLIKTKIDGKDGTAKFEDLIKCYQLQGHIDNESRSVAEQKRAMQQRMAEFEQVANARFQQLEAYVGLADQQLIGEFNNIDWQRLRAENPGEYSARLADFNARKAQLQQALGFIEQQRAAQAQQQQEQYKAFVAEQSQKLAELIPEWKDQAIAKKEGAEIREWGLKQGLDPQELDTVSKAAYVNVLRKAMLYDRLQSSKATIENKVRTAPKLVKPGQAQPSTREQQTIRNIKTQIVKSGGKQGVRDYLLATGKV